MSEFTVEVSRPGEFGALTSATLELPATWAEYKDAMDRARIIDDHRFMYSVEVCDIKRSCLQPHIHDNMHLLELNLLAQRMENYIKDELDVFEAMVKIETGRNGGEAIPLPRLINLTFSTGNCHVAGGIKTDTGLGKFLYENDFLSDEDAGAVEARNKAGRPVSDLFATFGKEHRANEGGVFTAAGRYVEFDGAVNEVYIPGDMAYFDRSGAPVVLEISKGFFNTPRRSNVTATLDLPAREDQISSAVDAVGAASLKEIGWRCAECLIPAAKELIDDAEDLEVVERFAKALENMQRHTLPSLYKAMFEAVKPPDLEAATELAAAVEDYTLNAETSGPEDYAREYLSRLKGGDERIDLSKMVNPYALGEQVMKLENAAWTSYGVLGRKDGGPIQAQADQPVMGMEMR